MAYVMGWEDVIMKYTALFENKGKPIAYVVVHENSRDDAETAAGFWAACFVPNMKYDNITVRED